LFAIRNVYYFSAMNDLLFEAIRHGRTALLADYIRQGGDVNVRSRQGSTFLHEAVLEGKDELLALLLASGADFRLQDALGNTPLHVAAMHGSTANVAALLDAGAAPDPASRGWTPLMLALNRQHTEIANQLLAAGAQLNAVEPEQGWTPLLVACEQGMTEMAIELIRRGASVQATLTGGDSAGCQPLHLCSYHGDIALVAALLEKGVEINSQPAGDGLSALHWAVYNHHDPLVRFLLECGADANLQARRLYNGRTALHYAVAGGEPGMVAILIQHGADPHIPDDEQLSPMMLAQSRAEGAGSRAQRYREILKIMGS